MKIETPSNRHQSGETLRNGISDLGQAIKILEENDSSNPALPIFKEAILKLIEGVREMHSALLDETLLASNNMRLAERDHLTEIHNRRGLETAINYMVEVNMEKVKQGKIIYYMCMAIDLDGFKKVNEILAHEGGDVVLKVFTKVLREVLREEDFVGKRMYHEGIEARTGGDEFMAVIPIFLSKDIEDASRIEHIKYVSFAIKNKIKRALSSFKFKKDEDGNISFEKREGEPLLGELVLGASVNTSVCKHEPHDSLNDVDTAINIALNNADAELEKIKKAKIDNAIKANTNEEEEQGWN